MRLRAIVIALLLWLCSPLVLGRTYVIASPEYTATVKPEEAQAYYQAIIDQLSDHKDVTLVENQQLKLVLDERDLSAAMGGDGANLAYAKAGKAARAGEVLVASLCKVGDDFILSLRMVSVDNGSTKVCATRRTRVVAKFKEQAALQVSQLLSDSSSPSQPAADQDALALADVRQACQDAGGDRFFPTLWQRAEKLRQALKDDQDSSGVVAYYVSMLHLAARAANPPPGMVFIPGGYVTMSTSAGKRQLWVEPFFMDRCEVSVAEYAKFLQQAAGGNADTPSPRGLTPITRNMEGFQSPQLPVTGVTFNAADAYARWAGKELPTVLQWMRAAYSDREALAYPCGDAAACAKANLRGEEDGFARLAPAAQPGQDESGCGVAGMTGNAREWTSSWYAKDAYAKCPSEAPEEPSGGSTKLVAGGSFKMAPEQAARSASPGQCKCGEAFEDVGFRCAAPFFRGASE